MGTLTLTLEVVVKVISLFVCVYPATPFERPYIDISIFGIRNLNFDALGPLAALAAIAVLLAVFILFRTQFEQCSAPRLQKEFFNALSNSISN